MSLTPRAEQLADLSEIAAGCAACFCRARCTGLDIKAIASVAQAAMRLGAEQAQLYAAGPPFAADAEYLGELEALRVRLKLRIDACARLYEEAYQQAVMAQEALRSASDEAARAMAMQMLADAMTAMDIAYERAVACSDAGRLLLVAEADFRWTYEGPEALVSAGHAMPHDGRWLTGQPGTADARHRARPA